MTTTLEEFEKELDVTLEEAIDAANRFTNDIRSFQFFAFFVYDLPTTEFLVALDPFRKKGEIADGTAEFIISCYEEKARQLGAEGSWLYHLANRSIAKGLQRMDEKLQEHKDKVKLYERSIDDHENKFLAYLGKISDEDVWDLARTVAQDETIANLQVALSLEAFVKEQKDKPEDYEDILKGLGSHVKGEAARNYTRST